MTFDELFDAAEAQEYSSVDFAIDDELRLISIPETGMVFGVEGDKDVNTVGFIANRYYRGTDLAEFDIRVVYKNANGELDYYTVTDKASDESTVAFSWTMGASAFKYQGTITLAVNFLKTDSSGEVEQAFNTTIATGNCLVGLSLDDADVPTDTLEDLLAHLTADLQAVERQAVDNVKSAQNTAEQAIDTAKQQAVQAVKDEGATQTAALNDAAEAHKNDLESIASHPPQPNTATGKWQVWNAETSAYQDTDALYQGGYYTPTVSDDGVLTWQGSQAGMPSLPSANVKGPKGDKGDPGLGVPSTTQSDAGKVPTVKADGSAYELAGPYAPLSAAIRPTANGNPAVCEDSIAWSFQGLKVYGKSTQDGTPSPENPVPIVSAGDGGDIESNIASPNIYNNDVAIWRYNGAASNLKKLNNGFSFDTPATGISAGVYNNNGFYKKPKKVWFSADITVSSTNFSSIRMGNGSLTVNSSEFAANIKKHIHGEATFDIHNFFVVYVKLSGTEITVKVENMMVSEIDVDGYFDYQLQPLTISTPNGLPGIPVNSGGNYVDASGQQLICDVVDFQNLEKTKNLWTIPDLSIAKFSQHKDGMFQISYASYDAPEAAPGINCACTHFLRVPTQVQDGILSLTGVILIGIAAAQRFGSVDAFNDFLLQQSQSGSPVKLIYQIGTPITTPLSAEEIAAYRALVTYPGTTVVSTAEDVAGLEVKYLADGEKYVERIVSQKAPEAAAAHTMALLADGIREGVNGV